MAGVRSDWWNRPVAPDPGRMVMAPTGYSGTVVMILDEGNPERGQAIMLELVDGKTVETDRAWYRWDGEFWRKEAAS